MGFLLGFPMGFGIKINLCRLFPEQENVRFCNFIDRTIAHAASLRITQVRWF